MFIIKKHSLKLKCQEIEKKKSVTYKTINWSAIKNKKNKKKTQNAVIIIIIIIIIIIMLNLSASLPPRQVKVVCVT